VFRTEHGYHFLEVTGRRVEDFSERFKQRQAENYLRNQMFDEELEAWLREIREEAFVEIRS
jgi:peptidyl-prolyl cis-trans isomerase SurA